MKITWLSRSIPQAKSLSYMMVLAFAGSAFQIFSIFKMFDLLDLRWSMEIFWVSLVPKPNRVYLCGTCLCVHHSGIVTYWRNSCVVARMAIVVHFRMCRNPKFVLKIVCTTFCVVDHTCILPTMRMCSCVWVCVMLADIHAEGNKIQIFADSKSHTEKDADGNNTFFDVHANINRGIWCKVLPRWGILR